MFFKKWNFNNFLFIKNSSNNLFLNLRIYHCKAYFTTKLKEEYLIKYELLSKNNDIGLVTINNPIKKKCNFI